MGAREHLVAEPVWRDAPEALTAGLSVRGIAAEAPLGGYFPEGPHRLSGHERFKRIVDVTLSALLLVFCAPVLLVIAALVALDSDGPILFRQKRLGLNGKPFDILKFRTMTVMENGDDVVQVCAGDSRVTRVGRVLRMTSLDELPQLINVLKGEMSLVGPRPHAVAHDRLYARLIPGYELRQTVKPGITGWAQVHGLRGETPTVDIMRRRVALDVWYATHANAAIDALILLRTPLEVLKRRNAH